MGEFSVYLDPTTFGLAPAGLRVQVGQYRSAVVGGPVQADLTALGALEGLWQCLSWLGRGVEIRDESNQIVWWGLLNDVLINAGSMPIGLTLDKMANRIKVVYAYEGPGGTQTSGETAWLQDNYSVSRYGTKDALVSGGRMAAAGALAKQATLLKARARPQKLRAFKANDAGASISAVGWWETLGWRIAQRLEGRVEWEGDGDSYRQAIGWAIVGSNRIGFHAYAIHDINARLAVLQENDKIVVSGSTSNNVQLTIVQADRSAQTVYSKNTIRFEPSDDIYDSSSGLGAFRSDEYMQVQGSASNSRYHVLDGTGEDHITVATSVTGTLVNEAAGPAITLTQGHRATVVENVVNESPGASVQLILVGHMLYQTFTPAATMNGAQVAVKVGKVGAPADALLIQIWTDSAGVPATMVGTGQLAASQITSSETWCWVTMTTVPTFSAGVTYGLLVYRTGSTDPLNYYTVDMVRDMGYGVCKASNGSTWVAHPQGATLPFKVWGTEDTVAQIRRLLSDYGQFFTGIDLKTLASGVLTNQYLNNDLTAQEEIEKLLALGTSSGQRLLAMVTPERVARIYAEPAAGDPMCRLLPDNSIAWPVGGKRPPGQLPVGEWLVVDGIPVAINSMLEVSPVFVDEASYTPGDAEADLKFKDVD